MPFFGVWCAVLCCVCATCVLRVCVPWCVVITLSCLMCFTLFLPLQYCLSARELARLLTCVTALLCGTFQMFCFDIVTYAHFSLSSLDFFIVRQMCLLPFFYPFFYLTCCSECTLQFAVDEFALATYGRKYMIVCIYGKCALFVQTMWMNESHCYRPNKMSALQLHWMRLQCTIKYRLFLSLIPLSSNDHCIHTDKLIHLSNWFQVI